MSPDPPAGNETGSASQSGALIFMSDASAEAERLMSFLRGRGYAVVDVPLGLLVNRVSVQRPSLILCDADAPGAVESVERIHRDVPGGHRVDVVFLREPGPSGNEPTPVIEQESSHVFERPVDASALARKVEALIGPPGRHEPRARVAAGGRTPILVAATRRPFRYDHRASLLPPEGPPSSPKSNTLAGPSPSGPPSSPESMPPSLPPPTQSFRRDETREPAGGIPQARLSPELEMLLGRAEQRVGQGRASIAPPSDRLSPEAELDAILPHDVLAALDEPLDLDDGDDSDGGPSTHGGEDRPGSRDGKTTGHGLSTSGTKAAPLPAEDESQARKPASDAESPATEPPGGPASEPPSTPAAVPTRPPRRPTFDEVPVANLEVHLSPPPSAGSPLSAAPDTAKPREQISTTPPRNGREREEAQPSPPRAPAPLPRSNVEFEVPADLREGDALRCLASAVRARYSGAIAFEDGDGIRRVVFRDGDFVTAATSVERESLVACLEERGQLPPDTGSKLGRKLALFGRHAGAALIAHGHLQQDELWPVLRTHAEWLLGLIARLKTSAASVEREVPARLATEPAVFGGAAGAEVLVEIVRRVTPAAAAIARLGGEGTRLGRGPSMNLLGECALLPAEVELLRSVDGETVAELLRSNDDPALAPTLLALSELGVLEALASAATAAPALGASSPDRLDFAALRLRIGARRALVDEADYFALLGLPRSATGYDVRRAYGELREEFDPRRVLTVATADLRDDVDQILLVLEEAHEILADDLRRERYRRALEAAPLR